MKLRRPARRAGDQHRRAGISSLGFDGMGRSLAGEDAFAKDAVGA
jgi:hypothetical protein